LKVLDLIAQARSGATVEELRSQLGLHRVSLYRYLGVLTRVGFVEKKEGRYWLGPKVLELASILLDRLEIRKVAHPFLAELSERLQITVHLAQLAGTEILYIDKIETAHSLPLYSRIGKKAPVYCTALGKVLLAFMSAKRREVILSRVDFKPCTHRTITDPEHLRKELETIRKQGYALDAGEHEEGIACVAAPIFDLYGNPVAAISVTDLARKLLPNEKDLAQEVLKTAGAISLQLGGSIPGGKGVTKGEKFSAEPQDKT